MAVENLITEHIDIWTSAVKARSTSGRGSSKKLELYGVKKLRDLILELAVRGKLVPQNPNDEPASFLLQRISEEKTQLIKEKKITKPKKLPAIKKQDITFALPEGWQACYFGDIYSLVYGDNLPKAKRTESGEFLVFGSNGSVGTHNLFSVGSPCLVIGRKGSAGAINLSDQPCWVTDVAYSLIPPVGISLKYCFLHLQTLGLDSLGKGIKPGLNRNEANALVVCIPPSDEQHRIVAKVDELMALCDQLEQQTETSIEAHQMLVTTLLDTLTNSADADELMQNWARISEHFDTLFTTEESIDQLKQTILQLAVMGKLVPQDPSDEPAAELLKRIAEEKAQLVKEKKIKKQKALPPIAEDEKPFELPNGWEWCRLGNLFSFLNGFAFKSEWFNDKGIRLLRNINIAHSETKWADVVCVSAQLAKEYEKYSLNAGDIVISLDRPIINTGLKYAVVDESDLPCLLLQRVAKFHSYAGTVSSSYLSKWLESDLFMSSIDPGRSNGVPHISTKQLEMLPFPLAPLSHQTRISDKVDEIIYLCQQLEIRVKESQITKAHLTDAIIEQTT
ncbi:TPA: restriction endonuclease subunit S [Vibrio parahaemolyticus]|nr:restriction endonuclease subunit S [Vibrio parahaemolyticus]HAS6479506.1 restriction endonuclease subunit S [Vibrio parahaemolyticus]HAS6480876.1 restriction endonuclease subunit S [Vibrio parahaemolyticus]